MESWARAKTVSAVPQVFKRQLIVAADTARRAVAARADKVNRSRSTVINRTLWSKAYFNLSPIILFCLVLFLKFDSWVTYNINFEMFQVTLV